MKKVLLFVAVAMISAISASAQKYAMVDMEYILKNIPMYESANEQIKQVSEKWQKEVEAKNEEAKNLYKNYQTEVVFLSDEMRVKKEKNIVYVIIATLNDSLFKICTDYDKNIPIAGKKVKRGSQLDLKMYSQIRAAEEAFNMMPVCNIAIDFHGVTISRGDFDDILICPELNGLYHK